MLYEYMLELGYTPEEINSIINDYTLKNYREDTLYQKIKEKIVFLENIGYSEEEVIKMTKTLPSLYGYGIENIRKK